MPGNAAPVTRPMPSPALPALTVAAIIERAGQFLMVEEWVHGRRVLNQPAGHVEPGESLLQAVTRETMEETGWVFAPAALVGIYLWNRPGADRCFLRVAFCGDGLAHHAGRPLDRGIIQTAWLSRRELMLRSGSLRSPLVMRAIEDHLSGSRRPLDALCSLGLPALLELAQRL